MSEELKAKAMCDACDIGKEVDEMLVDLREMALEDRDFKTLRMLRKVRRRPSLKNRVEAKVMDASVASLVASVPLVAPGVGKPGDQYVKYKTPLAPYAKDVKACHAI